MKRIAIAEAQKNLLRLVEQASAGERFEIIRNGARAVLIGADEYASLLETVAVLSHEKQVQDIGQWLRDRERGASFAADRESRGASTMREFWVANAGVIATPEEKAQAFKFNAEARARMDTSSLSIAEVATRLQLPLEDVQERTAAGTLYAYTVGTLLVFPAWQFNEAGDRTIRCLEEVLQALPSDLHPQSAAGFFLTPQPDLILNGEAASAKAWLEAGGSKEPVLLMAEQLA